MKIIYGLNNLKKQNKNCVVTIGIFDGVHIGHSKILNTVAAQARKKNKTAAVLTFHPHPQKVLGRKYSKSSIISLEHRLKLFQDAGMDLCVVIKFTRSFSKRSIQWFIKNILVKKLRTKTLIIGSRFKLGKEKLSAQRLNALAAYYGLGLKVVPAQKYRGKIISSSLIRNLIRTGRIKTASKLLARPLGIYGTVTYGRRIARTFGFKTANINPHHEAIPPAGVYAVKVDVDKRRYNGVLNIGFRPTFGKGQKEPTIEVHIIGFRGNLYDKPIELFFLKRIRPERHFKNKEALKEQIRKDILYNK